MKNSFNIEFRKGWLATCQYARGGHITDIIEKIEHEPGRGKIVTLVCRMTFAADDVQEATKPAKVKPCLSGCLPSPLPVVVFDRAPPPSIVFVGVNRISTG